LPPEHAGSEPQVIGGGVGGGVAVGLQLVSQVTWLEYDPDDDQAQVLFSGSVQLQPPEGTGAVYEQLPSDIPPHPFGT